jgi:hypothetical protein
MNPDFIRIPRPPRPVMNRLKAIPITHLKQRLSITALKIFYLFAYTHEVAQQTEPDSCMGWK